MAREQRLSFGEVAELYDKARPSYPLALVEHLVGLVGASARVLDVGCGTAKAAVLLARSGLSGVGLEPDPDMAGIATAHLAPFPGWEVAVGEFEEYRPGGGGFDLLTCAQAWHWLDPDRRFHHAARLLRPGGYLALFWNRPGEDPSALRRAVDAVYRELSPASSPHGVLASGQPPAGAAPPDAGFGPPEWRVFGWSQRYTTAEWTELVQTHSDHRMLAPEQRKVLLERVAEILDAHGGVYDYPYQCWLWWAARR